MRTDTSLLFFILVFCRRGISLWRPLLLQLLHLSSCQQLLVSLPTSCRLKILRKKHRCSVLFLVVLEGVGRCQIILDLPQGKQLR